jgi:hypothetical protein
MKWQLLSIQRRQKKPVNHYQVVTPTNKKVKEGGRNGARAVGSPEKA